MINSISHSLVNNPYNVPNSPIQQTVNREVAATHQSSSQSNTFSSDNTQAPYLRYPDKDSEFKPSMSIYELESKVTNAAQDSINEASANIQAQKESIWQLGVQQHYVNSQKDTLNAYVVSATGESNNDDSDSLTLNIANEGLTEKYMALVQQELKLKYGDAFKPENPEQDKPNNDVDIQPVPQTIAGLANQQVINQYNGVQQQGRSSLLHLSV